MRTSAFLLTLLLFMPGVLWANTQQLLQLIDYVGVDYAAAVSDGQVANPAEYAEMADFTAGIAQQVNDLPAHAEKPGLLANAQLLAKLIDEKAAPQRIKQLTMQMHHTIIDAYQVVVVPRKQPDLARAASLYTEHCASCHGPEGFGDGTAAVGMDPPPINFHDRERYQQRTLYGLYSTITQGVADTSMKPFDKLSDADRWSLAFYVGGFAAENADVKTTNSPLLDISRLTVITPEKAVADYGPDAAAEMAYLRHHPEALFSGQSHITFTLQHLDKALSAYQAGEHNRAYQYAVEAYLEGFELVEQNINALDKSLRLDIEKAMTGLRNKMRAGEDVEVIASDIAAIREQLQQADDLLNSSTLSGSAAFAGAFFILLREGLEAILVVAALAAFLVRTERRDALRYIHIGWISALVLGFFTWWASVALIDISGASREITEGVGALLATLVLLYVGFWLHDKTSAAKWQAFIEKNIQKALTSGTLWALAGLSFIAVYREAFETILFYQALWIQTEGPGRSMAVSGFAAAIGSLAVLAWVIMRYSARLPLRQFFSITGGLMFVLAIVFAGKGVAALQEAGLLVSSPVTFFRFDLLGIYPNLQGLLLQTAIIILALVLWNRKSAKASN